MKMSLQKKILEAIDLLDELGREDLARAIEYLYLETLDPSIV